jgi:hypothetical protein
MMTTRDRLMLIAMCTFVVLAAAWFGVVAPERDKASKLETRVSTASTQLSSAESELSNAKAAQTRYSAAYSSIVSLGKAVPPSQEIPSLVYQLAQASNRKNVDFSSIVAGAPGASGASGASAASGASSPSPSPSASSGSGAAATVPAATSSFTQMPFTFVFTGSFFDLEHLFGQLDRFTVHTASGQLQVSGRLLTIEGVRLAPLTTTGTTPSGLLTGTITATAYVLPANQTLTGGASPSSPAGAGSSSASAAATPAIVRAP